MAIRIRVDLVDNGYKEDSSFVIKAGTQPDQLPFEVVVPNNNNTGITVTTLRQVLSMAKRGKMTAVAPAAVLDPFNVTINQAFFEQIT